MHEPLIKRTAIAACMFAEIINMCTVYLKMSTSLRKNLCRIFLKLILLTVCFYFAGSTAKDTLSRRVADELVSQSTRPELCGAKHLSAREEKSCKYWVVLGTAPFQNGSPESHKTCFLTYLKNICRRRLEERELDLCCSLCRKKKKDKLHL